MGWNVPDDWGMYYNTCSNCGSRYHLSEGGCGCWEEEAERRTEEIMARLQDSRCAIDGLERAPARFETDDDLGRSLSKGEIEVRIFITEHDGVDELVFTEESWAEIRKIISFEEPKNNDGRKTCWWCGETTKSIPGLKESTYEVCLDPECGK